MIVDKLIMRLATAIVLLSFFFILGGCAKLTVEETRYYVIKNEQDGINVYRLQISAETENTDAKYSSGWYPRNSVDSLTGTVSAEQAVKDLEMRESIEKALDSKFIETYNQWLKIAGNSKSTPTQRTKALNTLRLILSFPTDTAEGVDRKGMAYLEYRPSEGVELRHADEKMVFMLSSDPTKVINAINNFTQSTETARSISKMSSLFGSKAEGDHSISLEEIAVLREKADSISKSAEAIVNIKATNTNSQILKSSQVTTLIEMVKNLN